MQPTHSNNLTAMLAISLELSCGSWKLAATDSRRERPSVHRVDHAQPLGRYEELVQCVQQLQLKWSLPPDCEVVVIYEAGQDGFWLARALKQRGWRVHVVDPASVPVSRQARRAKTDRLDALMLLENLLAWLRGERSQLRMVHIPEEQAEALRQLARDRGELQKEINQHRDRIRKLLRTVGCWAPVEGDLRAGLQAGQLRGWDGQPLPQQLSERLQREAERLHFVQQHFEALQRQILAQLPGPVRQKVLQLASLRGIGLVGAVRLVLELFWRDFHNRRQVGACVGLVPQPYNSGDAVVDQGISKQGNRRVRALLIEMAWFWLRYQPGSEIAQWFAKRTAGNAQNKRAKRIAIVAVARRLVIALWRFLQDGVVPQGAALSKA